jgi:hypothetical protein
MALLLTPLRRTRPYQMAKHWYRLVREPAYRLQDRVNRQAFIRFRRERGGQGLSEPLRPPGPSRGTALIVSQWYLAFTPLEMVIAKALERAGFRVQTLGDRRYDFLRYQWLAGIRTGYDRVDFVKRGDPAWVENQMNRLYTLEEWLGLEYQGVHVGRFTIASTLRHLRVGRLDFRDPAIRHELCWILGQSVRFALAASRALAELKPSLVLVMDRGYSRYGEFFDLALQRGIDAITWNMGYKSDRLAFKRYHPGNERDHPLAPSESGWRQICQVGWKPEFGEKVRRELFQCYESQDWFSVVGTQFDKRILPRQRTLEVLGIQPGRKVAVIFPHILWDGSFFYGKDLFDDYSQWLLETVRAAVANPRLDWVIKLHPAHLVKARQIKDHLRPAEFDVLESLGPLPSHIRLIHPDTDLSTYSLFQVADYVLTVRGTVGIEAAVFGIPVLTAGTGRYDQRGFTLDSSTREEYLARLARVETLPRLTPEQIELAERYAYYMLFCRPLELSSVSLRFEHDEIATPHVTVNCRTRADWLAAPDLNRLAEWLADGKAEDMAVLPA